MTAISMQRPLDTSCEYWYRYVLFRESNGLDEYGDSQGYRVRLSCREYAVIKHTTKGVWLKDCCDRKFVLKNARKRFACPTKHDALISFIARQKRRVGILKAQIYDSESALRVASQMLQKLQEGSA